MGADAIRHNVRQVAGQFAQQRRERQLRRDLDPADFEQIREAGFLLASLPVDEGGLWESHPRSMRLITDLLRTLAHGDSSVALVCSMHPAVLFSAGWPDRPEALPPYQEAWQAQRRWVFQTVRDGAWWGTIISEPGSGGDIGKTKAVARLAAGSASSLEYWLTGQKHFGSGAGITSYMITTAVPESETEPDVFFMDLRGVPWDGSAGVRLAAPWDGHGMTATQSHGMAFEDFPATRLAWPSHSRTLVPNPRGGGQFFAAVIVGIVETAVETARRQLEARRTTLWPYEQVEWSRAEVEAWLIQQAFEGMLRATEQDEQASRSALLGKTAIAELAESVLGRLCRVLGGGSYSRYSPFGFWYEDVRALGFLRPPWGLAFDNIFAGSWPEPRKTST